MAKVNEKSAYIKVDAEEVFVSGGSLQMAIKLNYSGSLPSKFSPTIAEAQLREALRTLEDHIDRLVEMAEDAAKQQDLFSEQQ